MIRRIFLCLLLFTAFSFNALAASFGKIEVRCPNDQCKIYIDDRYMATGSMLIKIKPGDHKIMVRERGLILLNTVKFVEADKYISFKAIELTSGETDFIFTEEAVTEPGQMPETPQATEKIAPSSRPAGISEQPPIQPATQGTPSTISTDDFSLHYYVMPGMHMEDKYCSSGVTLGLGMEFGWGNSLMYDLSLSSSSGNNKKAVISEGTLAVNNLDIGIVYKIGDFYAGTGAGYYTFNHTLASSVIKEKAALNLAYDETIDNNFGFYCKGGYRFTFSGINFDIGVKSVIVNTVATSTDKDKTTLVETENKLHYGLPITTVYLGVLF